MTEEEIKIENVAKKFARESKKKIVSARTSKEVYLPDDFPVSVFMAGSPGAGKTESSKNLIEKLSSDGRSILRIDTDDLRSEMPGYTGKNSALFQSSTSIIADAMQDAALKNGQSYIFDGTFTNFDRARDNIIRSLKKGREVYVVYVYQNPLQAWKFVKARELEDGRCVPKDAFVHKYFQARYNVNTLKKEFGRKLKVHLVVKNIDGTDFGYYENVDIIDNYIPERYSKDEISGMLDT